MILWRAKGPDGVEGTCPITASYVCTGLEYDIKVTGDKGRFDVVFAFRDEAGLAANVHLSGLAQTILERLRFDALVAEALAATVGE